MSGFISRLSLPMSACRVLPLAFRPPCRVFSVMATLELLARPRSRGLVTNALDLRSSIPHRGPQRRARLEEFQKRHHQRSIVRWAFVAEDHHVTPAARALRTVSSMSGFLNCASVEMSSRMGNRRLRPQTIAVIGTPSREGTRATSKSAFADPP
jgi:hypothetical protein